MSELKGTVETDTHIYFWGSIFSNFAPAPMKYAGFDFHTSEQLFMWLKAMNFNDHDVASQIVTQGIEPKEAKRLGRTIKGFSDEKWAPVREEAMYTAVMRKFESNAFYKKILLETGDKILVEGSPVDKIWGVGIAWDDDKILDENNWQGLNLLGKVLMKVREDIRSNKSNE